MKWWKTLSVGNHVDVFQSAQTLSWKVEQVRMKKIGKLVSLKYHYKCAQRKRFGIQYCSEKRFAFMVAFFHNCISL